MHSTVLVASAARRQRGFTLIELMIGVSVVGILSSVALPTFESQLQRSRRADVLVAMMQIQMAQERWRSNGTSYGSLADLGVPAVSAAKHYTLVVNPVGTDGYEAIATAGGAQARDTACRHMKLSATGMNLVYASGNDASFANADGANRACWKL
jgi:type IV pilus assembly protein PilE